MPIQPEGRSNQLPARMDDAGPGASSANGAKRILEPEIIQPYDGQENGGRYDRSYSSFRAGTFADNGFGRIWAVSSHSQNACLSPCITLAIFCGCLFQLGLLAAIGFMFFYTCGGIIGSLRSMRHAMQGQPVNPWTWRVGNWLVSFLITLWLAS